MSGSIRMLEFLVEGGAASPGPPIGPALGPLGLNVPAVVKAINDATEKFKGMRIPVKVYVDVKTKSYTIEVGVPTTAALLLREAGLEKGSGESGRKFIGDISFDRVLKVAGMVRVKSRAKTFKNVVKEVLGACVSMGLKVDGRHPKEVIEDVDRGFYDGDISNAEKKFTEG
ncbi:MAG: 50S ribosomal protein L11 [Nitrososphaerota archaeon]|nr:50S ribosomal protein L11 [Candidatus Bathyarchaeota archaeon]MDW8061917.1 50S ribosomal protein L11 [Nitrososphaerota archaeon]